MENKQLEISVSKSSDGEGFRGTALGLCFGSGAGIILGAVFSYVYLGFTIGAVVGIVSGNIYDSIISRKHHNS